MTESVPEPGQGAFVRLRRRDLMTRPTRLEGLLPADFTYSGGMMDRYFRTTRWREPFATDNRTERLWGTQPGGIRTPEHSSIETEAPWVAAYKDPDPPPLSPPGTAVRGIGHSGPHYTFEGLADS